MECESTLVVDLVAVETADDVAVLLALAARLPGEVVDAVSLVIRPADLVPVFSLWNDLPVRGVDDGVMVEVGRIHGGEHREILLGFEVPGLCGLGVASICELELRWADVPSTIENVVMLPVNVNVGAGDAAATGRS